MGRLLYQFCLLSPYPSKLRFVHSNAKRGAANISLSRSRRRALDRITKKFAGGSHMRGSACILPNANGTCKFSPDVATAAERLAKRPRPMEGQWQWIAPPLSLARKHGFPQVRRELFSGFPDDAPVRLWLPVFEELGELFRRIKADIP